MAVRRARTITLPDRSLSFVPVVPSSGEEWAMKLSNFFHTALQMGILLRPDTGYVHLDYLSFTQFRFYRDQDAVQELDDLTTTFFTDNGITTLDEEVNLYYATNGITISDVYDFEYVMPS